MRNVWLRVGGAMCNDLVARPGDSPAARTWRDHDHAYTFCRSGHHSDGTTTPNEMHVHAPVPQIVAALTDDALIRRCGPPRRGPSVTATTCGSSWAATLTSSIHDRPHSGNGRRHLGVTACVEPDWVDTLPTFSVRTEPRRNFRHRVPPRRVATRACVLRPVLCRLEPLHAEPAPVPRDRRRPTERAARHVGLMLANLRPLRA